LLTSATQGIAQSGDRGENVQVRSDHSWT